MKAPGKRKIFWEVVLPILAGLLVIGFAFRGSPAKDNRPNILLIVSEDHSPHLSCYGDTIITTPHLDALARDGVLFTNAYVTQSVCSPSRSSILSGLYPHQSGHLGLATHGYRYVRNVENIYRTLKGQGYRTGMIGKLHVNPETDFPIDYHPLKESNFGKLSLGRYASYAKDFFRESDTPFFLMVNYPDAHWPFQDRVENRPAKTVSPEQISVFPYIGWDNDGIRSLVSSIYNCISRLDECVGELMRELSDSGKEQNTLIIYLSDHGDQMARGKYDVYEASTRVPFIVRWPGKTRTGAWSDALVSTIDIVPTVLDALGLKATDKSVTGKSLLPLLKDPRGKVRDYLFTERNCDYKEAYFPRRAVRDRRFKLIYTLLDDRDNPLAASYLSDTLNPLYMGGPKSWELTDAPEYLRQMYASWKRPPLVQFYDLENDPLEHYDLSGSPEYAREKNRLLQKLKEWQVETDDPLRFPDKLKALTTEHDTITTSRNRQNWLYLNYLY